MTGNQMTVLQALAVALGTWVAWRVVKLIFKEPEYPEIPGPPSDSFLTGNMLRMFDKHGQRCHFECAQKYGRVFGLHAPFKGRTLYVFDPKALYYINIKEAQYFYEPDDQARINMLMFGPGLVSVNGERHRVQRKILNPVFSAAHMREMTPIFYGVTHKLIKSLEKELRSGKGEVDMLEWISRTALEIIGQSGFGYSFDTMEPNAVPHPFAQSLKGLFRAAGAPALLLPRFLVLPHVINVGSTRFRRAVVDVVSTFWKPLRVLRNLVDIMHRTSTEILDATNEALNNGKDGSERIGGGNDLMSRLVKANMSVDDGDRISNEELLAQVSTLTFGAMDTSSNAIASMLHLLSLHPEMQEKLRHEVTEAYEAHGGDLDYETLTALPLLDAVVRETLRLWPPIPFTARQAQRDTVLPLDTPVISTKDGSEINEIFVPSGTTIIISMLCCNRDPRIWGEDASEWKPERWMNLPDSVSAAKVPGVYSHIMTFVGGSRSCIGFKFAQLEIKAVMSMLLKSFRFTPSTKKILWEMNGIVQPTTEEAEVLESGDKRLELPLGVSLVSPRSC